MAVLNAAGRNALPDSDFAIIATVNGKKVRSYPIQDIDHARDALSRVAQDGTPADQAKVRAAVLRRYPQIGHQTAADRLRGK